MIFYLRLSQKIDYLLKRSLLSLLLSLCVIVSGFTSELNALSLNNFENSSENLLESIIGSETFLTFCAGCHGTQGFSTYKMAPSFAMGDRLQKSDNELLQSILKGIGAMPSWEDKLPYHKLKEAITYLRSMNARLSAGYEPLNVELPEKMYTFVPIGEKKNWWYTSQSYE